MAVGDSATLALGVDASGAVRGAAEFVDALKHIEAAGRHAEAALKLIPGASDAAAAGTDKLDKSTKELDRSLKSTRSGLLGFVAGLGASAGAMAGMQLKEFVSDLFTVADAYQRLDSRIALYVGGAENATKAHQLLLAAAQATGVSFESTGGFFAKLASQADALGVSYEDLVGITQTVQQSLIISGASASEAASGMQQLGQAFTRGKLGGDEFISMGENAPRVLDLLEKALGKTRGELAEMSKDGQLTSQVMIGAFQNMASESTNDFQTLGNTVEQESTRMRNAWKELLVEMNKTGGASELAISGISAVTAFLSADSTHAAINDFAKDIRSLIADLRALIGMGSAVADKLNFLNQFAQSQGKEVNRLLGLGKSVLGESESLKGYQSGATGSWVSDYKKMPSIEAEAKFPSIGVKKEIVIPPKTTKAKKGKSAETLAKEAETFSNKVSRESLQANDDKVGLIIERRDEELRALKSISLGEKEKADLAVKINKTAAAEIADIQKKASDKILQSNLQATDQEIALIKLRRDEDLEALSKVQMSEQKKAELAVKIEETAAAQIDKVHKKGLDALAKYEEANLSAHGKVIELVQRQRDEEIRAIDINKDMDVEQKAQARVLAEDTASQKIIEIRRHEAEEIRGFQEENLQTRAGYAFGDERKKLQKQLLEMQRESRLSDIQASKTLSDEAKAQATALTSDTFSQKIAVIDPTPWEAASRNLQEFGENLTSVDGISQGVIQGIASIGSTAASAFADAIVSGESFADTLDSLGKTLEKMLIQMTLQMAMQQALGAGASMLGASMAGSSGTAYSPAEGAGVFGGTAATMAKGGVANAGLVSGVYSQPTYFRMADAAPRATALMAAPSKSNFSYERAFAQGGAFDKKRGLMGEAGPEAVLPLTRTPTGQLGVATSGDGGGGGTVNITVNNNSKANVSTESSEDGKGNKDIIMTIADQVEGIVASRMSRSGTRVNRSVSSVGAVVAR